MLATLDDANEAVLDVDADEDVLLGAKEERLDNMAISNQLLVGVGLNKQEQKWFLVVFSHLHSEVCLMLMLLLLLLLLLYVLSNAGHVHQRWWRGSGCQRLRRRTRRHRRGCLARRMVTLKLCKCNR